MSETTSAVGCSFGPTARYLDAATEIAYHGHRWRTVYYATWLSPDPIGFEGGDANLYRYCGNDPVNAVDPSGLYRQTITIYINPKNLLPDFNVDKVRQKMQQAFDEKKIDVKLILSLSPCREDEIGWQYDRHCWYSQTGKIGRR